MAFNNLADMEVIDEPSQSIFDTLIAGVRKHNHQRLGSEPAKPIAVIMRNKNNEIIAGVSGRTIYQHFLVDLLWVDESARGQGLGQQVMQQAEVEARKRGCIAAQVDTLSVQAPEFYQKLGFEIVGKVDGLTKDHDRYFLAKHF
ncbi:MAG: GNAT family N-acetyltransferase [Parashewanella sp.]